MEESIRRVIEIFGKVKADWALVGAHATGMLTEPRATQDVDFVVDQARFPEVLEAVRAEFPGLEILDIGPAVRLQPISIDLIRSGTHSLFGEALRSARKIEEWRVPDVESLIALKYLAAIGIWRDRRKRAVDMADLIALYQDHKIRLDRERLIRLGGTAYPGAEREFAALLDRIDRGDPISI